MKWGLNGDKTRVFHALKSHKNCPEKSAKLQHFCVTIGSLDVRLDG